MSKKKKKGRDFDRVPNEEDPGSRIAQRDLLINAWRARDALYGNLFGEYSNVYPENYEPPKPLIDKQASKSSNAMSDSSLEDQQLAVLAYGPDPFRSYWIYITAGLCTPWLQQQPEEVSGFGCELMIKSPNQADWPIQILKSMAYYIFNHAGTLSPGIRIGLNAPIVVDSNSQLRNLLIWYADEAPDCWYQLPSGGFGIFTAVGITDDELKFAESIEEYGTWCMQQVLRQTGSAQVTDPDRESVMQHKDINQIVNSVTTFARQFRASESNIGPG